MLHTETVKNTSPFRAVSLASSVQRNRLRFPRLSLAPWRTAFIVGCALAATGEELVPATATAPVVASEEGSSTATPPGRSRFWQRFSAYEPTYLLGEPFPAGDRPLNLKLQISVAFQVLGKDDEPRDGDDRANGLYTTFTQTSYWDIESESKPFLDSDYQADLFWHQGLHPGLLGSDGLALEGGLAHTSNGRAGEDSRSVNVAFVRPIVRWDVNDTWWVRLSPRFHVYVDSLAENPEIQRYRGFVNLDGALGMRDGLALSFRGRMGSQGDRGLLQADLSYPLDEITHGWVHGFAYLQGVWGWSENLLEYDQRVDQPRVLIGMAFTR